MRPRVFLLVVLGLVVVTIFFVMIVVDFVADVVFFFVVVGCVRITFVTEGSLGVVVVGFCTRDFVVDVLVFCTCLVVIFGTFFSIDTVVDWIVVVMFICL